MPAVGGGPEHCILWMRKRGHSQDGREWSMMASVTKNPSQKRLENGPWIWQ